MTRHRPLRITDSNCVPIPKSEVDALKAERLEELKHKGIKPPEADPPKE